MNRTLVSAPPIDEGVATRAHLDDLEAAFWREYLADTEYLDGAAYALQERRSWGRLREHRLLIFQRRRLLELEEALRA